MKQIASILMLLAITVTLAGAQQRSRLVQSLSYSGVQIKLGDQEQPTIQQLRNQFTVVPLDSGKPNVTNYLVSKKSPNEIVGVIVFRAGKLVKAYRDWTPDNPSAYALVVALKGAMEMLKSDGPCTVDSGSVQEPNYLNQSSSVICGSKYVEVTAIESSRLNNKTKTTVSIFEWLSDFSAD
jgi:hypothetical protein